MYNIFERYVMIAKLEQLIEVIWLHVQCYSLLYQHINHSFGFFFMNAKGERKIYSSLQQALLELYAWCVAVNHFSKGIDHINISVNILIQCRSLLYQHINNTFLYNA